MSFYQTLQYLLISKTSHDATLNLINFLVTFRTMQAKPQFSLG